MTHQGLSLGAGRGPGSPPRSWGSSAQLSSPGWSVRATRREEEEEEEESCVPTARAGRCFFTPSASCWGSFSPLPRREML